jgi:nucleotide-binding universal stress UspA family protein
MNTIETVVGWDGSEQSIHAVDWAARRASLLGGALLIATATDRVSIGNAVSPEQEADLREELAAAAERVRRSYPQLSVFTLEIDGTPLDVLVALSDKADLVVVGASHSNRPHHHAAWSVGSAIAVHSRAPVTIIPDTTDASVPGDVVVGIDGSELSRVTADFAAEEARLTGVRLRIVHVWQEPDLWMRSDAWVDDILHRMRDEHEVVLNEFTGLIVVGSRARTRVSEVLLGSVTHELLVKETSPTVIVPIEAVPALNARFAAVASH